MKHQYEKEKVTAIFYMYIIKVLLIILLSKLNDNNNIQFDINKYIQHA